MNRSPKIITITPTKIIRSPPRTPQLSPRIPQPDYEGERLSVSSPVRFTRDEAATIDVCEKRCQGDTIYRVPSEIQQLKQSMKLELSFPLESEPPEEAEEEQSSSDSIISIGSFSFLSDDQNELDILDHNSSNSLLSTSITIQTEPITISDLKNSVLSYVDKDPIFERTCKKHSKIAEFDGKIQANTAIVKPSPCQKKIANARRRINEQIDMSQNMQIFNFPKNPAPDIGSTLSGRKFEKFAQKSGFESPKFISRAFSSRK